MTTRNVWPLAGLLAISIAAGAQTRAWAQAQTSTTSAPEGTPATAPLDSKTRQDQLDQNAKAEKNQSKAYKQQSKADKQQAKALKAEQKAAKSNAVAAPANAAPATPQ